MTDNNSFFPFPVSDGENKEPEAADSSLPAFPDSPGLDNSSLFNESEIRDLRKLIELYRQGKLLNNATADAAVSERSPLETASPVIAALPTQPADPSLTGLIDEIFTGMITSDTVEQEAKVAFKSILAEILDHRTRLRAFAALCGIFPVRKSLRHGTPEQRLFALNAMGDRYLESMAGLHFNERKKLLKAVARYLSQISDGFNFIQMEGEAFSSQYHERVPGASAAGKTVREMHGFLIVGRDSNQVVRIGQVLT